MRVQLRYLHKLPKLLAAKFCLPKSKKMEANQSWLMAHPFWVQVEGDKEDEAAQALQKIVESSDH
jgi:hypothetical protein